MGVDRAYNRCDGFTLIELSIVLVVIGLIVGGILVGQSLINAAAVRAQVTQIEKYNTAANTFREKYGYLPGDIKDPDASSFGFIARGQYAGEGDGNGVIQGSYGGPGNNHGDAEGAGETLLFWSDLSAAHLIEGSFTLATPNTPMSTTSPASYFPLGKIGRGNYVYAWSGSNAAYNGGSSTNYYGLSTVSGVASNVIVSTPGLAVAEAYNIDQKIDDGLPQSGKVLAFYLSSGNIPTWAGNSTNNGGVPFTTAIQGSSSTCFDNGNVAGAAQQYSIEISSGANVTCGLSFKMQAGD
jgi:prepilin-type N-terminal cleavage/methylation domain-containing protein